MDNLIQTFLGFSTGLRVALAVLFLLFLATAVASIWKHVLEWKLCGGDYSKLGDIKHELAHKRLEERG